jgi:uncharacterized protein YpmS
MKTGTKMYILVIAITLLIVTLACQFPGFAQEQSESSPTIPVTTQSVEDLQQEVQGAIATAQSGGQINLVLTEEQLTSLAALEMQAQPDANLSDIQVRLRDNQIQITGKAVQSGLELPLSINLSISVQAGNLHSSVVSASIGPFSLPDSVLNQITTQLDQALSDQLAANMVVDQITIQSGRMTIEGHLS